MGSKRPRKASRASASAWIFSFETGIKPFVEKENSVRLSLSSRQKRKAEAPDTNSLPEAVRFSFSALSERSCTRPRPHRPTTVHWSINVMITGDSCPWASLRQARITSEATRS